MLFIIHVGVRVVGPDELRLPFDGDPLPAGTDDHDDRRVGAEMGELAGAARGDEGDGAGARHRVRHDAGVDDRRLRGPSRRGG